jgi:hypothetical protein
MEERTDGPATQSPGFDATEEIANQLFRIVGKALCESAAQSPGLEIILRGTLARAVTNESEREFLKAKGWLS